MAALGRADRNGDEADLKAMCGTSSTAGQPIDRGLHDDVSQVKRIEDAGVEDGNRWLKRHSAA